MATDYDAPRKSDDETESLDAIKERGSEKAVSPIDSDEVDVLDGGAGLTPGFINPDELAKEMEVLLLPPQDDEFTCIKCFIVRHKSLFSHKEKDGSVCIECEQ